MHTIWATAEEIADVIGQMTIAEKTDMGVSLVCRGMHVSLGECVAISNAIGPSLIIHNEWATNLSD